MACSSTTTTLLSYRHVLVPGLAWVLIQFALMQFMIDFDYSSNALGIICFFSNGPPQSHVVLQVHDFWLEGRLRGHPRIKDYSAKVITKGTIRLCIHLIGHMLIQKQIETSAGKNEKY